MSGSGEGGCTDDSAAVAIHAPGSVYAGPAFASLSHTCDIASAARDGCRARNGLSALRYLKGTAQRAIETAARQYGKMKRSGSDDGEPDKETETYLEHLKSTTRVVRVGFPSSSSPVASPVASPVQPSDVEYPPPGAPHLSDYSQPPIVEYSPEAFMANLWQQPPLPGSMPAYMDTDTSMALGMQPPHGFEFDPFGGGLGMLPEGYGRYEAGEG